MRIAYADPPYLGQAKLYREHPDASRYDTPEAHAELMASMDAEYDAWALSLSSPSLRVILPLAPDGVRVGAWVKPFASFKPGVDPAYAWEPVIFRTARKWSREQPSARDYVSCKIALEKGLAGAKPEGFCFWLFGLLGAHRDDEFTDLFHGSGQVARSWDKWSAQGVLAL